MNDIKNKLPPLQNNLINNEDHIDVKMENQSGNGFSPKSKSISNLSTNCSIDLENKQNNNIDPNSSSILKNLKFTNKQKNTSSGKKRDHSRNPSRNPSVHTKRRLSKINSSIKNLIKELKKLTKKEEEELKDLFTTYISDINKNTSDSNLNLNSNSNLTDNDDIYKKIFSLIKSEDSSSSEEIDISEQGQGNFTGELENNFLFSFDNGRLLKLYKDFQFIGKGGFGVVFKATQKIDESQCAIKVMKINLDIKEDKEKEDLKVTQEIKSMLKFKKKNIVRYKTCWFEFKQKKAKKKRDRAMSLEQRYTPGIDFKNDNPSKGNKKFKNRLKNYLKTSLERIQSISKEIKLAEKQNNAQKNRNRKSSIIWDEEDESDSDSLGANKNYAIKEEGEDTYIKLDDNESNIEEVSESLNDENEDNSNSNSGSESENSNSEDENSNNINEFKTKDNIKEEKKIASENNDNQDNSGQKDKIENFQNTIKEIENNSNSNLKLKNINNCKDFSSDNNEDNNEDEYNNLRNKKNLNNESSSINTNSKDNNFILVGRDSENNSIFDEEIKKGKEEINKEKNTEIYVTNSNEESESDEDEDEDEDEDGDDLKNNSDNEGLRAAKKKKKKKKSKTYPIYFFIQMEYCSGCPMNYYLSHRSEVPSRRLTTYMLYQMCNAVKHIHEGNIIHRDLKPGNIFIIDDYLIKIGDFGLALNSTVKEYKQGGTYLYQSPEQIKNEPYDEKIDIFALGVILVELVSKFNTEFERRETLQGLKKEIYPEYLKKDHLKEYNLVRKMTRLNPKERPNIKDIFNDNDFNDLITESSA
jgi:serine/threonine protein kinase